MAGQNTIGSPTPITGDPREILSRQFGMSEFRTGQHAVIERLLAGKNVAAVFPTGGGKSLCYQLPSQMFDGTTIVVSPLIALMKDQCDALAQRGISAARLDSSLSASEIRNVGKSIRDGSTKLLYVSPERFFNERFLATLDSLHVSLFAIDEAHCISQWGHNFRPDYLKLAEIARQLRTERILALTATATPEVLTDIRAAFQIAADDAICTPFHRPNLVLRSSVADSSSQYETLLQRLTSRPHGSTLIYVTLQKTAEELADRLTADGMPAIAYHAGLASDNRAEIQQQFIDSENGIVVATIAFGMGIDKSNIRYVYHYNPPKSLESYAQEIGRAGRDGDQSICELILVPDDRIVLENFIFGDTPSRHGVQQLVDLLVGQPDEFYVSHFQLAGTSDIRILVVRTLITYLELDGYLKSTSPRYDSYKINPLVSSKKILGHFEGERRQWLAQLLSLLVKGRSLFSLNLVTAARTLNCERRKIVTALEYLAERNWLEIKVSDLVHGYRWIKRINEPKKVIADDLYERLQRRERSELGRLDDVFELVTSDSCQAGLLAQHFGQSISQDCGQCSACLGQSCQSVPDFPSRSIGSSARAAVQRVVKQFPDQFTSHRDQARFLCGLTSPGFTRSRLSRDANFGVCRHLPFADVLAELSTESN